jgi:hypothetical protein
VSHHHWHRGVREERDEDVSLDAALVLMEDRTYRQILFQVFERLFHRDQLDIYLDSLRIRISPLRISSAAILVIA